MIDAALFAQALKFCRYARGAEFQGALLDWRLDGYLQIVCTDRSVLHTVALPFDGQSATPFTYADVDRLLLWLQTCQPGPLFFGATPDMMVTDCALSVCPDVSLALPFAPGEAADARPAILHWQDLIDRLGEPQGFTNPDFVLDTVYASQAFKAFKELQPRAKYVRFNVFGTEDEPAMLSHDETGVALYRALVSPWT